MDQAAIQDKITQARAAQQAAATLKNKQEELERQARALERTAWAQEAACEDAMKNLCSTLVSEAMAEHGYKPGANVVYAGKVWSIEALNAGMHVVSADKGRTHYQIAKILEGGSVWARVEGSLRAPFSSAASTEIASSVVIEAATFSARRSSDNGLPAADFRDVQLTDLPAGYRHPTQSEIRTMLRKAGMSTHRMDQAEGNRNIRYSYSYATTREDGKIKASEARVKSMAYDLDKTDELAGIVQHRAVSTKLKEILEANGWLADYSYEQVVAADGSKVLRYATTLSFKLANIGGV